MPGERGLRGVGGVDEVDAAIDELYANAPDAFTKKRDELAKKLKADGKGDAAPAVKALRKPTQIAYVLNQVARRFPDEVGELVDVGRELARAQRKALRGGDASGDLRAAIGRQREVVRDLTTKTGGLMRELGLAATGHLDEIAGALQAALVDPVVGAQLEEGRLDKVPAPATGFPGAAPQAAEPERAIPAPPKSAPRRKTARERQEEARQAKREAAERAREAKERAKREAARKKLDAKAAAEAERRQVAFARAKSAADTARARANELADLATEKRGRAEELLAEAKRLHEEAKRIAKEAKETDRAATQADADADKAEKAAKAADQAAKRLATKARAG